MSSLGAHHLADLHGVDAGMLRDESLLMSTFDGALAEAGFHVLQRLSYRFAAGGEGVTGIFLLSESHLAFHTYPEFGYLALDLFSCGAASPQQALDRIVERFAPASIEVSVHPRGERVERRGLIGLRGGAL